MARFTDINTSFRQSNADNNIIITDMQSIAKGLERFFTTGKGEVPFNRNYGSSLKRLLFENNLSPSDVRMFLYMDITNFEPRINISPAGINVRRVDLNAYEVTCNFTVPALNNQSGQAQATVSENE